MTATFSNLNMTDGIIKVAGLWYNLHKYLGIISQHLEMVLL